MPIFLYDQITYSSKRLHASHPYQGFTIVEIGIVMVIVGLLIGFGASLIVPLSKRAKRIESQEIVNSAIESILGYSASNGRLPIWGDNVIDNTVDEFCEVVARRRDANGRALYYFYSSQLASTGSICNRKTTDLALCLNVGCEDRVMNVAFAVVSASVNANPQTGIVTTGCPSGTNCIGMADIGTGAVDNCTNDTDCPAADYDASFPRLNRPEEYDDIVKWVTLNQLKSKIACTGPPLKILNTQIPTASLSSLPYTITFYAEGGIPFGDAYNWGISLPDRITAISPSKIATANPWHAGENTDKTWNRTPSLTLTITAISSIGTYPIHLTVRDNNDSYDTTGPDTPCDSPANDDNCAQRIFILTVNP